MHGDVVDSTIWGELVKRYHPVLQEVVRSLTPAGTNNNMPNLTWRSLFLQRCKNVCMFRHDKHMIDWCQYHPDNIDDDNTEFTPLPLDSYTFIIDIHQKGKRALVNVEKATLKTYIGVDLELNNNWLNFSAIISLNIFIQSKEGYLGKLYSGVFDPKKSKSLRFPPYSDFEKFCSHSWFVNNEAVAFPFVMPKFRRGEDGKMMLNIETSWRNPHDERSYSIMDERSILTFLQKGLTYKHRVSCGRFRPQNNRLYPLKSHIDWVGLNFAPKPLSSYSFLVDFVLYTGGRNCLPTRISHFYESAMFERNGNAIKLKFEILPNCIETAALISHEDSRQTFFIVVYILDRETGKQAKLYEGSSEYMEQDGNRPFAAFHSFEHFERFSASSFFSGGGGYTLPIPSTSIDMYNDDISSEFRLELSWQYRRLHYFDEYWCTKEDEVLAFLEKGLVYR